MKRGYNIWTVLFLLCIGVFWFVQSRQGTGAPTSPSPTTSRHVLGATMTTAPAMPSTCHEQNGLPDPTCTPGSINTVVTQDNIASTICVSGYTKTIRPSVSYTQQLKRQQIVAYGYTDTSSRDYEEDHLISLELGGNPTDPKNLWPEPGASPNSKDTIENICHEKVCSGQMRLADAQREIATNWKTACE